jgi:putative peptidoglycan lipid II flippase
MTTSSSQPARTVQISQGMSVGRAAWLLSAMIALSRVIGFGRTVLTSHLYGQGAVSDAYYAAFNIPDTISILIAGGALATGFVPVFTELVSQNKQAEAQRTFRAMWTLLALSFGAITALLFALTWTPIGQMIAVQQAKSEADLYLYLLRVLLIAQFFFVVGGLFSGTLNALRLFWYSALQPVVFNLGILVFGLVLPHISDLGIKSQAWGALAGAIVGSILIQLPAVRRSGLSLRPLLDLRDVGVNRVLKSLLPIVFGLASGQVIALNLPRFFAGALPFGNLSALDNANRLMQVPLDLLASGPAIALFPTLALLSTRNDVAEMRLQLSSGLRRTLTLIFVAAALLMALRLPIVRLLLEHGKFRLEDTKITAVVLLCYGLCLPGLGAQQFLARGFYALGDTKTPVIIGVGAMIAFCAFGLVFTYTIPLGAPGLAIAAAISVSLLSLAMGAALRAKLHGWDEKPNATRDTILKSLVAAVAVYFVAEQVSSQAFGLLSASHGYLPPSLSFAERSFVLVLGAVAGAATFLLFSRVLDLPLRNPRAKQRIVPETVLGEALENTGDNK